MAAQENILLVLVDDKAVIILTLFSRTEYDGDGGIVWKVRSQTYEYK